MKSYNGTDSPTDSPKSERLVLLFGILFPSFLTYIFFVQLADASSLAQQLVGSGLKTVQFLLPVIWICGVLRQKPGFILFSPKGLAAGLLFGSLIAGSIVFALPRLLTALGELGNLQAAVQQKISELGFVSRSRYIALSIFYTLAHSLLEEYYWRWFIFGRLRQWVSVPSAVAISSVGFTLHHVIVLAKFLGVASLATWLGAVSVGIGGAVWALLYHRSDRLFGVWCSHALVDAAIFWIGYTLIFPT